MTSKKQRFKKKLDRLLQQKFMANKPRCIVCGRPASEGHHYIQKSQSLWLRWDLRNLVPLCKICHCSHHRAGNPRIHQIILKKKGHKWADMLENERRIIFKDSMSNLRDIEEELKEGL